MSKTVISPPADSYPVRFLLLKAMKLHQKFSVSLLFPAFVLLLLGLYFSAAAQKDARKKEEKKPAWVTQRPVDKNYYQGIGVAIVNNYTQAHVEDAKKKALNDLISEISVSVKSNSVLQQIEENDDLKSMYQSMTRITAENDIEGYELYDSWGDDSSYWVYYRLSKEYYQQTRIRRIGRATAQAVQYREEGVKARENGNIARAYEDFIRGLSALRDYLDNEISISTDNGKEYLADLLIHDIIEMNRSLVVTADKYLLKVRLARPVTDPVRVEVRYKEQPVEGLLMRPYFTQGAGEVPSGIRTGKEGWGDIKIQRVTGGQNLQQIEVSPDVEGMTGEEAGQQFIAGLIRLKCNVPVARINIETVRIVAFMEAHELEFGRASEGRLARALKKHLSDNGYSFSETAENADAIIRINISSKEGEEYLLKNVTLYTTYLDCFITIISTATGNQIYYKGFSREKGSRAGGFDQALREAEDNVLERFKSELLPEINKIDL